MTLTTDDAMLAFDKVLTRCERLRAKRRRVTRQQKADRRTREQTGCSQIHIQALRVVLKELE